MHMQMKSTPTPIIRYPRGSKYPSNLRTSLMIGMNYGYLFVLSLRPSYFYFI